MPDSNIIFYWNNELSMKEEHMERSTARAQNAQYNAHRCLSYTVVYRLNLLFNDPCLANNSSQCKTFISNCDYNFNVAFLCALDKLWRVIVNFVMSVYPSVCLSGWLAGQSNSAPTGHFFMKLDIWRFTKSVEKLQVSLKTECHVHL